jgi:hypothetical protein
MPKQTFRKQRGASNLLSMIAFAVFLAITGGVYLLFEIEHIHELGIHVMPTSKNFSAQEKKALLEKIERLRK